MEKQQFVSDYKSVPKATDAERLARWNRCQVCEYMESEWIGGESRWESDDKKKSCSLEKCPAFWFTQFKDAKCPLNKW